MPSETGRGEGGGGGWEGDGGGGTGAGAGTVRRGRLVLAQISKSRQREHLEKCRMAKPTCTEDDCTAVGGPELQHSPGAKLSLCC